jgi:putative transposase
MEERIQFLIEYKNGGKTVLDLARKYGISEKTAHKWLRRMREEGFSKTITPRSSLRKTPVERIDSGLEERIVGLRKQKPRWGGKKIAERLMNCHPEYGRIHASTVSRVLTRYGLVKKRKKSRVKNGGISTKSEVINECNEIWTIDFKGDFVLGNKSKCYPLTIQDFASRYLLCCHGFAEPKISLCIDTMDRVFTEYGLPKVIHSDNGSQFVSPGLGGLNKLSIWWIKQGIIPKRSRPRHPEENPRHERMHRELKAETTKPPKADFKYQQEAFDKFRDEYNNERPHEGIGMKLPKSLYVPSSRRYKNVMKLIEYSAQYDVQQCDKYGYLRLGRRKFHINLALSNEFVGIKAKNSEELELYFGPIKFAMINVKTGLATDLTKLPRRRKSIVKG